MNEGEAYSYILSKLAINPQKVTLAKIGIFKLCQKQNVTEDLVNEFLKTMDSIMPKDRIVIQDSVDSIPSLEKIASFISWQAASAQAIWELIHENFLIPGSPEFTVDNLHVSWTTVVPGSGGHSGGWNFSEFFLPVPRIVLRSLSIIDAEDQFLSNYDLYMNNLQINNVHPDIRLALQEAVKCFRHELFTAAVTMLGKASEGAWLELGASLMKYVPTEQVSSVEKIKRTLEDPTIGIGKKIDEIVKLYERQDIFLPLTEKSNIRLQELRISATWSDTVRDSRNTIHFGVEPSTSNTYEKVAALLLGAVPNFRILYSLKSAADE